MTNQRVEFVGDPSVVGTLVVDLPWDQDGLSHVVWDGDTYICVLQSDEIRLVSEQTFG